jgi:hypothetical protein
MASSEKLAEKGGLEGLRPSKIFFWPGSATNVAETGQK